MPICAKVMAIWRRSAAGAVIKIGQVIKMITVCTERFAEAIKEAATFSLPDMTEGTGYLYKNLYNRLSKGEDVTLSSLDFDAFEQEDIDSLNNLHSDVFERNHYAASGIMSTLQKTAPICKAVGFV